MRWRRSCERLPRPQASAPSPSSAIPTPFPQPRIHGSSTCDDATFARERGEFLDVLLDAIDRGGWLLARPCASAELSTRLEHLTQSEGEPGSVGADNVDTLLPMAAGLVASMRERGEIHELAVARWRAQDQPTHDIVETALGHLSTSMRSTLGRLCLVRRPITMNGSCGPFGWGALDDRVDTVERGAVEQLIQRGLERGFLVGRGTDRYGLLLDPARDPGGRGAARPPTCKCSHAPCAGPGPDRRRGTDLFHRTTLVRNSGGRPHTRVGHRALLRQRPARAREDA